MLIRIARILVGILGINLVIFVHELGHALACLFVGVPVEEFSIGFGPPLKTWMLGSTQITLASLPIGGFVQFNHDIFALYPYTLKMFILLAGIVFNIIFGYGLLWCIRTLIDSYSKEDQQELRAQLYQFSGSEQRGFIGPIGIIRLLGTSLFFNPHIFGLVLATLSINVGMFNLLPIPPLDGGHMMFETIQLFTGPLSKAVIAMVSNTITIIFLMLLVLLSMRDMGYRR